MPLTEDGVTAKSNKYNPMSHIWPANIWFFSLKATADVTYYQKPGVLKHVLTERRCSHGSVKEEKSALRSCTTVLWEVEDGEVH